MPTPSRSPISSPSAGCSLAQRLLDEFAEQLDPGLVVRVIQLFEPNAAMAEPLGGRHAHHPQLLGDLSQVLHGEQEVRHRRLYFAGLGREKVSINDPHNVN